MCRSNWAAARIISLGARRTHAGSHRSPPRRHLGARVRAGGGVLRRATGAERGRLVRVRRDPRADRTRHPPSRSARPLPRVRHPGAWLDVVLRLVFDRPSAGRRRGRARGPGSRQTVSRRGRRAATRTRIDRGRAGVPGGSASIRSERSTAYDVGAGGRRSSGRAVTSLPRGCSRGGRGPGRRHGCVRRCTHE